MEPVTHFLTGACIGRAGLNRKTAYATLAAVLAAEAADIDILWVCGPGGRAEAPPRHYAYPHCRAGGGGRRGGFGVAAAPVAGGRRKPKLEAAMARDPGAPIPLRLQQQPVSWIWLYATALIAALSHLLLDWTNNYGVRPFFPFNPRWYAGSFMFIAEPVLWGCFFWPSSCPGCSGWPTGRWARGGRRFADEAGPFLR